MLRQGFSLVELLSTLTIMSLLLGVAVPSLESVIHASKAMNNSSEIQMLVRSAKSLAVTSKRPVIICPYSDHQPCGSDWNKGLKVLYDTNSDSKGDSQDIVVTQFLNQQTDWQLISYPRKRIIFNPRGFAQGTTGSLTYCADTSPPTTSAWVVSRVGRIRAGIDTNGNGIVENASGKDVPCP